MCLTYLHWTYFFRRYIIKIANFAGEKTNLQRG